MVDVIFATMHTHLQAYSNDKFLDASKCFEEALALCSRYPDGLMRSWEPILTNLGHCYRQLDRPLKVRSLCHRSLWLLLGGHHLGCAGCRNVPSRKRFVPYECNGTCLTGICAALGWRIGPSHRVVSLSIGECVHVALIVRQRGVA